MTDFETYSEDEITCPFCGYQFSDSWEMSDEDKVECYSCDKTFRYSRDVRVSYGTSGHCEDNGEECKFGEWSEVIFNEYTDKYFSYAKCNNCSERTHINCDEFGHPEKEPK